MKPTRRLTIALVLIVALATPVYAGQIGTMGTQPPPPQGSPAREQTDTSTQGQGETDSGEVAAAGSVFDDALRLLQSVLSLF